MINSLYKVDSSFHNEFSVNSQQLLFINLLIVAIVAVFFLAKRLKHKQPLQASSVQRNWAPPQPVEILEAAVIEPVPPLPESPPVAAEAAISQAPSTPAKSKRERIYFMYNGHEWDAFEVLGLISGVTLETATRHYQELIKTSDPSTFEFYDAAFSSFLKLRNSISKSSVE